MPREGEVIDGYRLVRNLGHGGIGSAFQAVKEETGETVVLKFLDANQLGDPAVYERFRRELTIGKKLDHPGVSRAISANEESRFPYLVMTFAEGRMLSEVLEQGPVDPKSAASFAKSLAETLAFCHEQGVIHRDLKPENVVVAPQGTVKIIDFGIALLENATRVTWRGFSGLAGTPEYMSPEQIRGERGGAPADIYALGIMLYEMLAGQVPYHGDNPMATMYLHLTGHAKPLVKLRPETPEWLAAIAARAMRRRRSERYQSMNELLHDLEHPESVDCSWLTRPDPPIADPTATAGAVGRQPWFWAAIVLLAAAVTLALWFFARR